MRRGCNTNRQGQACHARLVRLDENQEGNLSNPALKEREDESQVEAARLRNSASTLDTGVEDKNSTNRQEHFKSGYIRRLDPRAWRGIHCDDRRKHCHTWRVRLRQIARSVFIAIAASYVALDLGTCSCRKRPDSPSLLSGGAFAMGVGMWACTSKDAGLSPASACRVSLADASGSTP